MKRAKNRAYALIDDFFIRLTDEMIMRIEGAKTEIELENYVKTLIDHKLGCVR